MSQEKAQQLIKAAIKAAQSGDKALARKAFIQAIKLEPRNETALLGLVTMLDDDRERMGVLRQLLTINPQNPKALEVMKRLNLNPEQVMGKPTPPQEPAPAPSIEQTRQEMPIITPTEPEPEAQPLPKVDPYAQFFEPDLVSEPEEAPAPEPEPEPAPEPDFVIEPLPTLEEVLAKWSQPIAGDNGIPVVPVPKATQLGNQAQTFTDDFLAKNAVNTFTWGKKSKDRAAEREIRIFQAQVASAVATFLLIVGGFSISLLLTNPEIQRLVFRATATFSATPTVTPTPTPGITHTPSPTAELTLTPSPTFPSNLSTANPYVQPRATSVYAPRGVVIEAQVSQIVQLMDEGRYSAASTLLQQEIEATSLTGSFVPYYYLVDLQIRRGNLDAAREALQTGITEWETKSNNESFRPLIDVATARLDLAELQQARQRGVTPENFQGRLNNITETLEAAIAFDGTFVEAYVLLTERYLLTNDIEDALNVLSQAEDTGVEELRTNTALRTKKAEVLFEQGRYNDSLQELYEVLLINPYAERALQLQVQCANALDDYGLAVVYAEQYMGRYPGSVLAIKMRGDAWLAQGKPDLALQEYTRALAGDQADPAYLEVLISRAELFMQSQRYEEAQNDYSEAFRISDDPRIQLARMQAAYLAGNDTLALNDAEALATVEDIPQSQLDFIQARVAFDRDPSNPEVLVQLSNVVLSGELNDESRAIANTLLAQAYVLSGDSANALTAITAAINVEDTAERRYIRAQVWEVRANDSSDNQRQSFLVQARNDYEFVITWSQYFTFPFTNDARERYQELSN
jgi:tetratricopeptide (TPR) repeat protein